MELVVLVAVSLLATVLIGSSPGKRCRVCDRDGLARRSGRPGPPSVLAALEGS
jgi:hypothetical protein